MRRLAIHFTRLIYRFRCGDTGGSFREPSHLLPTFHGCDALWRSVRYHRDVALYQLARVMWCLQLRPWANCLASRASPQKERLSQLAVSTRSVSKRKGKRAGQRAGRTAEVPPAAFRPPSRGESMPRIIPAAASDEDEPHFWVWPSRPAEGWAFEWREGPTLSPDRLKRRLSYLVGRFAECRTGPLSTFWEVVIWARQLLLQIFSSSLNGVLQYRIHEPPSRFAARILCWALAVVVILVEWAMHE